MITPHPKIPGAVLIQPAGSVKIDNRCPVLIPISKNLTGPIRTEPVPGQSCPCECYHPTLGETINTYTLRYENEWRFSSNDDCDRVKEADLLDGGYMIVKGELKLRDWGCPPHIHPDGHPHEDLDLYIGCQTGEFTMYRPIDPGDSTQGYVPVFVGELIGTVGVDPQPSADHPRCCHENQTRGMLKGQGVGPMDNCELCATYEGFFNSINDVDLCLGLDFGWEVNLDGIVCCPCPESDEGEETKR